MYMPLTLMDLSRSSVLKQRWPRTCKPTQMMELQLTGESCHALHLWFNQSTLFKPHTISIRFRRLKQMLKLDTERPMDLPIYTRSGRTRRNKEPEEDQKEKMEGAEGPTELKARSNGGETLSLESGKAPEQSQQQKHAVTSAHTVDKDSWQQVGVMLVTSFNCAYVLSFSNLMLVPLGWAWGMTCLVVVAAFAYYANWLLAGLHVIDGQRFIRYRDLMGYTFGNRMYYLTYFLQFTTLLLGNMGFILLGGRALKEINSEFSNSPLRLQYYIVVTGIVYFIFAYLVPTMSAMRNWLATSAILTIIYEVILVVILVKDGRANKTKDYNIPGSQVEKVFNAFGAVAAILVCNTSGLLPEIQSTLRKPVVSNMRKALTMQFTIGLVIYYGISIAGYWAYGSAVSEYLPYQLSGPKWANIVINLTAFLQSIISQHMFCAPIHEALDTKFQKLDEGMFSRTNLQLRFLLRALLFGLNTFVTALFPFMGDFVNLFGSFTLFPLTFVFPSMVFLKVRGKSTKREEKAWHWANIVVFLLLSIVTTAAAVRLIVHNARVYHFFADT